MRIAIIPARGGSKRIPGKNIRPMNGKPLIAWTIDACQKSGLFEHILVSTDSPEIAAVARDFGAEVPFLRPAELADDHCPTAPVVEHALSWASEHWGCPDSYCQFYANPFIFSGNIRKGHELLVSSNAAETLTVTTFPYPILRAFTLNEQGAVQYAFPKYRACRSQDLPEFYHDAGQFYWHACRAKEESSGLALPIILPRHLVVDIDTEEDWLAAEKLHKLFLQERAEGV